MPEINTTLEVTDIPIKLKKKKRANCLYHIPETTQSWRVRRQVAMGLRG